MVAANLWKIHTGGQDFTPKAQSFRDTIEFWKRIVRRKQGVLIYFPLKCHGVGLRVIRKKRKDNGLVGEKEF